MPEMVSLPVSQHQMPKLGHKKIVTWDNLFLENKTMCKIRPLIAGIENMAFKEEPEGTTC